MCEGWFQILPKSVLYYSDRDKDNPGFNFVRLFLIITWLDIIYRRIKT